MFVVSQLAGMKVQKVYHLYVCIKGLRLLSTINAKQRFVLIKVGQKKSGNGENNYCYLSVFSHCNSSTDYPVSDGKYKEFTVSSCFDSIFCIMQASAKIHNLEVDAAALAVSLDGGSTVTIDLTAHNVPYCANEVIIYVRVVTGLISNADYDGDIIIQSGEYQRKVLFHAYPQYAWSYTSQYLTLPISTDRMITAKMVTERRIASIYFIADVQLVGYTN